MFPKVPYQRKDRDKTPNLSISLSPVGLVIPKNIGFGSIKQNYNILA